MLHPTYARKFDAVCRVAEDYAERALREFISGRMGLRDVENLIEKTEDDVGRYLGSLRVQELELYLVPHIFSVNRILCSGRLELSPEVQIYVCSKPEKVKKELKKLRKVEMKVIRSGKASNVYRVNELEGLMLGYPECCVKEFSKRKKLRNSGKKVKSLEGEIAEEYLKLKLNVVLENLMSGKTKLGDIEDRLPKSLFALNFYPCSLTCEKAKKVGEKCKEALKDVLEDELLENGKFKGLFEAGVVVAMCDIEVMCVKMGKVKGKDYIYLSPDEAISRVLS